VRVSLNGLILGSASFLAGAAGGLIAGKRWGIPLLSRDSEYSIAIYEGPSIEHLQPAAGVKNPIITAADITDLSARFVADPFLLRRDDGWSLFFEVIDRRNERGSIGHAFSVNGRDWTYDRIVLTEPYHLSYPFVFEWQDEIFMVPESAERYEVRLYRARQFPDQWEVVNTLLRGPYVDSTLFRRNERWWMFTAIGWGNLHLFHAENLFGPWSEHPRSPLIVANDSHARPGGRVVVEGEFLLRFAQDDYPYYGRQLRAFGVDDLTVSWYAEHELDESPLLVPGMDDWNRNGMHHLDAHQRPDGSWLAAVDGFRAVLLLNRRRVFPARQRRAR
jgi:hypothetical protein